MERDLAKTAKYFGITRPTLIKLMREKGLINDKKLPAYPTRDREYLGTKNGQWWHPKLGMQYSLSTRVKQAGLPGSPNSWDLRCRRSRQTTVTWPREYARQILALRTKEERNAALLEVPEHLRELTKRHCLNAWNHPARHKRKEAQQSHEQ